MERQFEQARILARCFSDLATRRDATGVSRTFATQGVWKLPGLPVCQGRNHIRRQFDEILNSIEFLVQMPTEGIWELSEDGALSGRTYVQEWIRDRRGKGWFSLGVYLDRVVPESGSMRFAERRFEFVYRGTHPLPGKAYGMAALSRSEP